METAAQNFAKESSLQTYGTGNLLREPGNDSGALGDSQTSILLRHCLLETIFFFTEIKMDVNKLVLCSCVLT